MNTVQLTLEVVRGVAYQSYKLTEDPSGLGSARGQPSWGHGISTSLDALKGVIYELQTG
jgi:hypothetical protein